MAKLKGGLGDNPIIKDLTKPISFHISEELEAPPVFERRKTNQERDKSPSQAKLIENILDKAAAITGEKMLHIVFFFQGVNDLLLLEGPLDLKEEMCCVSAVRGRDLNFSEILWEDSVFSSHSPAQVIDVMKDQVSGVEVITGDDCINFSSIDDFYEWLEI